MEAVGPSVSLACIPVSHTQRRVQRTGCIHACRQKEMHEKRLHGKLKPRSSTEVRKNGTHLARCLQPASGRSFQPPANADTLLEIERVCVKGDTNSGNTWLEGFGHSPGRHFSVLCDITKG